MDLQNHTALLDGLATMGPLSEGDIIRQQVADRDVRKAIMLDPSDGDDFECSAVVYVYVRKGGKETARPFYIRSIPAHLESKIKSSEVFPELPRKKNADGDWVEDEAHPKYTERAQEFYNRLARMKYRKIVYGLDMTIKSVDGSRVVWGEDCEQPDVEAAIESLRALKLSEKQVDHIIAAINTMSEQVATESSDTLEKKS